MSQTIEFWFDFVSPYAYLATQSIEDLARKYGRTVDFKPILLGAVFQETGSKPLTMRAAPVANYSLNDFARSARFAGLPFKMPKEFPINTQNTARVAWWLKEVAPERVGEFVRTVTRIYFSDDAAINDVAWLSEHVNRLGLDGSAVAAVCADPARKEQLKQACADALQRGIFGAPWIVIDGEAFWGNDRLPQVERWLAQGGF